MGRDERREIRAAIDTFIVNVVLVERAHRLSVFEGCEGGYLNGLGQFKKQEILGAVVALSLPHGQS